VFVSATLAVTSAASSAFADELPRLTVQRTQRSTDCPDADTLAARVNEHMGRVALDTSVRADRTRGYDVQILAEDGGYVAILRRAGRADRARTLSDPGPGCAGLADALSVTLAILLDQAAAPPPPAPAVERRALSAPAPAAPSRSAALRSESVAFTGGVALSAGLLERVVPAFVADVSARPVPRVSLGLGLVLPLTQRFDFAPGAVDVSLTLGLARACYVAPFGPALRSYAFAACPEVGFGALRGAGVGYPVSRAETRTWWLLGAGFELQGPLAGPVGWSARLDLLAPTTDERFGVDGLPGNAFDPPPLTGALGLGLRGSY
jgi:hypothetical protein